MLNEFQSKYAHSTAPTFKHFRTSISQNFYTDNKQKGY